MTTLLLARKKMMSWRLTPVLNPALDSFLEINKKGVITLALGGVIILSASAYILATYTIFGLGPRIQEAAGRLSELKNDHLKTELELQKKRAGFLKDHKSILESMEKISTVKYLRPENFVARESQFRP